MTSRPHSPALNRPDTTWLRRFRTNLRKWYDRHARDLPWRRTSDPYRVWISEIMLQQTTVVAVIPYYERFLRRFPTVDAVANAAEVDVLRAWEGLGYYSRARNIHRTARRIVDDYSGRFPASVDELLDLPGIGRYTAGAIVSFAFGRPAPIVEANTLRLYSRVLGFRGDPRSSAGQRVLWGFAETIQPRSSAGRFNQALMDLGAEICAPAAPKCAACPLKSCCRAFADGMQDSIPEAAPRPETTHLKEATVAVGRRGAYLLRRRGENERWAGLWDFPRFSLETAGSPDWNLQAGLCHSDSAIPKQVRSWLAARLAEQTGLEADIEQVVAQFRHSVTRYRIHLVCLLAKHRAGTVPRAAEFAWVRPAEFAAYPLSVTGRKLAGLLQTRSETSRRTTAANGRGPALRRRRG